METASSITMSAPEDFHLFPLFPAEIQLMIAGHAVDATAIQPHSMNQPRFKDKWLMFNINGRIYIPIRPDFRTCFATGPGKSWCSGYYNKADPFVIKMDKRHRVWFEHERWLELRDLMATSVLFRTTVFEHWLEECRFIKANAKDPEEWTLEPLERKLARLRGY